MAMLEKTDKYSNVILQWSGFEIQSLKFSPTYTRITKNLL